MRLLRAIAHVGIRMLASNMNTFFTRAWLLHDQNTKLHINVNFDDQNGDGLNDYWNIAAVIIENFRCMSTYYEHKRGLWALAYDVVDVFCCPI